MDADLLPELSGETWVASALLEELTADLPTAGLDIDLIAASRDDSYNLAVFHRGRHVPVFLQNSVAGDYN